MALTTSSPPRDFFQITDDLHGISIGEVLGESLSDPAPVFMNHLTHVSYSWMDSDRTHTDAEVDAAPIQMANTS